MEWKESEQPRDKLGRFTSKELEDMSADELKAYILEDDTISGAVSGARNPNSEKAKAHAKNTMG